MRTGNHSAECYADQSNCDVDKKSQAMQILSNTAYSMQSAGPCFRGNSFVARYTQTLATIRPETLTIYNDNRN